MTPNLPVNALAIFGPDPSSDGQWGGVPWPLGVIHAEPLEGMAHGSVTVFPGAPVSGVLAITDQDNDLDGPGGWQVDPDGQPQTSLRYPGGASCNSREFPGGVISPALEKLGIRLGDFFLLSWNGAVRSGQVYDIGPLRKAGEGSIFINRGVGLVTPDKTDHWAARNGHDAQDVVALFFPGSGPGHALPVAEIVARTHALWKKFTGRPAAAPDAGASGTPVPKPAGGAASGSVGLAAPLALSLTTFAGTMIVRMVAVTPPPEFNTFLASLSCLMSLILMGIHIRNSMRPDPPLEKRFASLDRLKEVDDGWHDKTRANAERIEKLESRMETQHKENSNRLDKLNDNIDRNYREIGKDHDKLREEMRHDVRNELTPLRSEATATAEGTEKEFRKLAGEIGELKASARSNDALSAEVRQMMTTVLQRLPRGGAQNA